LFEGKAKKKGRQQKLHMSTKQYLEEEKLSPSTIAFAEYSWTHREMKEASSTILCRNDAIRSNPTTTIDT